VAASRRITGRVSHLARIPGIGRPVVGLKERGGVGGILTIVIVLGWPIAHRQVVVLRLRHSLRRIDDVLAGWQQENRGGRSPNESI